NGQQPAGGHRPLDLQRAGRIQRRHTDRSDVTRIATARATGQADDAGGRRQRDTIGNQYVVVDIGRAVEVTAQVQRLRGQVDLDIHAVGCVGQHFGIEGGHAAREDDVARASCAYIQQVDDVHIDG